MVVMNVAVFCMLLAFVDANVNIDKSFSEVNYISPSFKNQSGISKRTPSSTTIWNVRIVYYSIANYDSDMSRRDIDEEVDRAFKLWSEVCGLKFVRLDDKYIVHIRVRWARRSHAAYRDHLTNGVHDPLFGNGAKAAHSFRPQQGGSIHLDSDAKWVKGRNVKTGPNKSNNLFRTMMHEIGWAIGMPLSSKRQSAMHPDVHSYVKDFELSNEDVLTVQKLYGSNPALHDFCKHPRVDAATMMSTVTIDKNGYNLDFKTITIVFRYGSFQELDETGRNGYVSKRISEYFPGLPNSVQGAFQSYHVTTHETQNSLIYQRPIYIFKDNSVWRYSKLGTKYTLNKGYPKYIQEKFPGMPSYPSAVVYRSKEIKFIQAGRWCSSIEESLDKPSVYAGCQKLPSNWGFSTGISGMLSGVHNSVYVFRGEDYYNMDINTLQRKKGYPRSNRSWFCPY